jgi:tRNA-binding EMAP/Myf-like protein
METTTQEFTAVQAAEPQPAVAVVGVVHETKPIEGADRIHQAIVSCGDHGIWSGVVPKEINAGDGVLVLLQDALLPADPDHPRWGFMRSHKFRVRMARFKGCPSECVILALEADEAEGWYIGQDVGAELGITKYSKPIPATMVAGRQGFDRPRRKAPRCLRREPADLPCGAATPGGVMSNGWIAVDMDGTLATYDTWVGPAHLGDPIAPMVERVKRWLAEGREVRIFTARAYPLGRVDPNQIVPMQYSQRGMECAESIHAIRAWCDKHLGRVLTITCIKDYGMDELYDDRAIQVRKNTGELVGESTRGLA